MIQLYLSRRNLLTLLSKLDRAAKGELTARTLIKHEPDNPDYPNKYEIRVTAVEDSDYYISRDPDPVHPREEATIRARGVSPTFTNIREGL
jgi:hypothetical protein